VDDPPIALISDGWREDGPPASGGTGPRDARWWGVVLLVWSTLGATAALQQAAASAVRGELRLEWLLAVTQIPRWLFWVPLTPLIFTASQRYPFSPDRIARSLFAHLSLMVIAIVLVEGAYAQLAMVVERLAGSTITPGRPSALMLTEIYVLTRVGSGVVTYTAVVCVASALGALRRLREHDVRAARLEADLSRAQVQAIKMQVQPHFLFNTLHAINVLIRENPTVASRMVTQLGDLLRHTLSRATVAEVSLRAELDILALYLEIERVRFEDRLTVTFDVPPGMMSALVPELVLQPLAENAIKHGIGSSTGGVSICIRAQREGEALLLEVVDTGPGPADDGTPRERIGLATVRARLERLYGNGQSLAVERAPGGGCVARITLPFREAASSG